MCIGIFKQGSVWLGMFYLVMPLSQDIIPLLLEDNVAFELPLAYRESLVTELKTQSQRMDEEDEATDSITLERQAVVCNIIREVLEGRPANTAFWLSLENCTEKHLDLVFSVSVFFYFETQAIPLMSRHLLLSRLKTWVRGDFSDL